MLLLYEVTYEVEGYKIYFNILSYNCTTMSLKVVKFMLIKKSS